MPHAKLHWHCLMPHNLNQSSPQLFSIGAAVIQDMSSNHPNLSCLEKGCAQFPRRSAFYSSWYLGNVTERVGNITISKKTELNLARWSKQRIKYTKFGPDISGEIITAHPASGHIFKRKWIGDSIAFYSSVSYYRQRKFTWGLRASSSSHNKWKD